MYFKGKWSKRTFKVIREIGAGANGIVYEVEEQGTLYALKASTLAVELQSEINHIAKLSKTQGSLLESYFILADDDVQGASPTSFYVMKRIQGTPLSACRNLTPFQIDRIGKGLLKWLSWIHKQGYIVSLYFDHAQF